MASRRLTHLSAGQVQHINDHLMESIDKILERQEKIELLAPSRSKKMDGCWAWLSVWVGPVVNVS